MTTPMPDGEHSETARYLSRALQLNPAEQADELVELRNSFLVIQPAVKKTQAVDSLMERRGKVAGKLAAIRKTFWKEDLDTLRKKLARLQVAEFPDLKQGARRLRIAADERHLFGQLVEKKGFNAHFFKAFRAILVSAPRESANVRDEVYALIRGPKRLATFKKMVKLIRRELPNCYALEEDWLVSIERIKKVKIKGNSDDGGSVAFFEGGSGSGCLVWFLVFVLLRILRLILSG